MMLHFPNRTLHRYTYTKEATDVYGAPVFEYEYSNDLVVDFQPERSQELRQQYGVETESLYKIFFQLKDDLNASDELHDNEGNIYSIIGDIEVYDHFLSYKKAHLVIKRTETTQTSTDTTGNGNEQTVETGGTQNDSQS